MTPTFHIERLCGNTWKRVEWTNQSRAWCNGWLDCVESMVPHDSYRLVETRSGRDADYVDVFGVKHYGSLYIHRSVVRIVRGLAPSPASSQRKQYKTITRNV